MKALISLRIYLPTYLPIYLSTHPSIYIFFRPSVPPSIRPSILPYIYLPMSLQNFVVPWPLFRSLILHAVGWTPWTGDQPIARPQPIHRTKQRIKETNIHALGGIRTHDPSVRASEDISCVRPRSHCDWHLETDSMKLSIVSAQLVDVKSSWIYCRSNFTLYLLLYPEVIRKISWKIMRDLNLKSII
jgi:hypothetical protein